MPRVDSQTWYQQNGSAFFMANILVNSLAVIGAVTVLGAGLAMLHVEENVAQSAAVDEDDSWHFGGETSHNLRLQYFEHLTLNTAIQGRRNQVGRDEWSTWGFVEEPEPNFTIGVWQRSPNNRSTYSTRGTLNGLNSLSDGSTEFGEKKGAITTAVGVFNVVPFSHVTGGLRKSCLGFGSTDNRANLYLRGYYCSKSGAAPDVETLTCVLSSFNSPDHQIIAEEPDQSCAVRTVFQNQRRKSNTDA
ncbi:MAG: hypothetical protein AAGF29_06500 [Pseudomonadota bacterium]